MASAGSTFAGDAASIASNPSNPLSWAKLAGDVFGGLFGGGGGYATATGQHTYGHFDATGFHGASGTISSVGTEDRQPQADIENEIKSINAALLDGYKRLFGNQNVSIPVDITTSVESSENGRIAGVASVISNYAKANPGLLKMDETASTIDGTTNPTGESTKTPGTKDAAIKTPPASSVAMPSPAIAAGLLFLAARYL